LRNAIPKHDAFLAAFKLTASITKAAAAAKCERGLHYRWLAEDPTYAAKFEDAKEEAAQTLEDEAIRRAHEGVSEPLVYQGSFGYSRKWSKKKKDWVYGRKPLVIQKYSDALMIFLLKGFRPDKYRERGSVEVTGKDGGAIVLENKVLKNLDDDELAGLIALTRKLTTAPGNGSGTEAAGPE
jgi:hypothetical protein